MDPQVALLLLRQCGGFCKLVHLARSTPPSLIAEGLEYFDNDVRHCFALSTAVDTTNSAWKQAQLSLSTGVLGLSRLSEHSSACYIASLSMAGVCSESNRHLLNPINHVSKEETVTLEAIRETPCRQKLEPSEFQAAIQWWLVLVSRALRVQYVLTVQLAHSLDRLGYHALTSVETYGCWSTEAKWALSQLASCLATRQNCPKSAVVTALYQRLSMTLVRANVRALLSSTISDAGY
eukprot:Em0033g24a